MTERSLMELARETEGYCVNALDNQGWVGYADHAQQIADTLRPIIEGALQRAVAEAREETMETACEALTDWVLGRIEAEVSNRPDVNIFKDILSGTWNQVRREGPKAIRRAFAAAQDDPEVSR